MLQVIICPNQFGNGLINPLFFDAMSCSIRSQYFDDTILSISESLRLMKFNKNPFGHYWLRVPTIFSTDSAYSFRLEDRKLVECPPDQDEKLLLVVTNSFDFKSDEVWLHDGVICFHDKFQTEQFVIDIAIVRLNSFDGCVIYKDPSGDVQIFSMGGYNRILYDDFVDFISGHSFRSLKSKRQLVS